MSEMVAYRRIEIIKNFKPLRSESGHGRLREVPCNYSNLTEKILGFWKIRSFQEVVG